MAVLGGRRDKEGGDGLGFPEISVKKMLEYRSFCLQVGKQGMSRVRTWQLDAGEESGSVLSGVCLVFY